MTELLTAAQMRAIEQAAIESGEVTGLELMERAGRGVVEAIFEEWPELAKAPHRAVVLCGPGNNGGDGFVVARLLKEWGWEVEVYLYGDPDELPPDAKVNYGRWLALGEVQKGLDLSHEQQMALLTFAVDSQEKIVFVDAVFGIGLARPLQKDMTGFEIIFLNGMSHRSIRRVAIDLPSGICSDSGRELGSAFRAELTVAFHDRKLGHLLEGGAAVSEKVVVKSIGLKHHARWHDAVELVCSDAVNGLGKRLTAHKFSHGHALILSGGSGKTGAARLAARGALRIGAGLVTVGVPPAAQMEVASQVTAVMLKRVKDGDGLAAVLEDDRLNALCLGPGLGIDRARGLVPVAVRARHTPYVTLDADALTAYGEAPEELFGMLHDRCVLTPHGGEFARLFPDIAEKLNAPATNGPAYSKVDATREAAKRAGCVVLFKGPDTVIADPDGRCSINSAQYERAAPWLATAGSGDVLAGFITGLLARGFDPMQAAEAGAWLHVECARSFGPGLIAEDLPEELPKVFRELGL